MEKSIFLAYRLRFSYSPRNSSPSRRVVIGNKRGEQDHLKHYMEPII